MNEVSLDQLSARHFQELVGTLFQVLSEPAFVVTLELTAATVQAPGGFSLLFTGPIDRPLDQRTYPFEHERIGRFDLFIVPVGADRSGRQYEAVFNRRANV